MERHVKELESQIAIEKKILAGAESIIREYTSQKKVDKKTLANAEATLTQSKDKLEELTDELTRFKITNTSSPLSSPIPPLKREMSVSDLDPVETLSVSTVSHRIQRLMEKIEIELTVKAGAQKMAKALSATSSKGDKSMGDLFDSLSNSSSRITLMMTALQKYQSMTLESSGLMHTPQLSDDLSRPSLDEENNSSTDLETEQASSKQRLLPCLPLFHAYNGLTPLSLSFSFFHFFFLFSRQPQ